MPGQSRAPQSPLTSKLPSFNLDSLVGSGSRQTLGVPSKWIDACSFDGVPIHEGAFWDPQDWGRPAYVAPGQSLMEMIRTVRSSQVLLENAAALSIGTAAGPNPGS